MRTVVVAVAVAVLASLTACGGGGDEVANIQVFKHTGSLHCSGGGLSLEGLQAQLTAANVQVRSASCGTDGFAHAAICGGVDNKIGIFDISSSQAQAAAAAGFQPLSQAPQAKVVPCT